METITVKTADGTEVQVPVDNLPDEIPGYVPEAELASNYVPKAVHNREFAKMRKQLEGLTDPDSLVEDEEFKQTALAAWGIDPESGGEATQEQIQEAVQAELERQRRRWEREHLQPVTEERDTLQERTSLLQQRDLERAILEAAQQAGVKKSLLKRPGSNMAPPIVAMHRDAFAFDPETKRWYQKADDGDGFAYGTGGYKTPVDYFEDWKNADKNIESEFFEDTRQSGPGAKTPKGGVGGDAEGGIVVLPANLKGDAAAYREYKKRAEEAGATLKIEGEESLNTSVQQDSS